MITFANTSRSITWPNPTLGGAEQLEIPKIIRRSMSGKLYSYVSKRYPIKWILGFNKLKQEDVDNLRAFMTETNGDDIIFTDWRNRQFNVKIVSNPLQFTQSKDFYQATLELRGYNA